MKTVPPALVVLAAIVIWVGSGSSTPAPAQPPGPPSGRWEYKVVTTPPNEDQFNKLGAEGWELATTSGYPGVSYSTFKRPKR